MTSTSSRSASSPERATAAPRARGTAGAASVPRRVSKPGVDPVEQVAAPDQVVVGVVVRIGRDERPGGDRREREGRERPRSPLASRLGGQGSPRGASAGADAPAAPRPADPRGRRRRAGCARRAPRTPRPPPRARSSGARRAAAPRCGRRSRRGRARGRAAGRADALLGGHGHRDRVRGGGGALAGRLLLALRYSRRNDGRAPALHRPLGEQLDAAVTSSERPLVAASADWSRPDRAGRREHDHDAGHRERRRRPRPPAAAPPQRAEHRQARRAAR